MNNLIWEKKDEDCDAVYQIVPSTFKKMGLASRYEQNPVNHLFQLHISTE